MSNNYQRLFYIFKNMDSDIGYPTGYIKVEINCEVAKLQISLSNILNRQGLRYKLYGIKKGNTDLVYTVICDIPIENGRADIKINSDIHKIGSNALNLEDINIFAVITQIPNKVPLIKCPLVTYTKSQLNWKKEFEELLLKKNQITGNNTITNAGNDKINVERNDTKCDEVKEDMNIGRFDEISDSEQGNRVVQLTDILDDIGLLQDTNGEIEISNRVSNIESKIYVNTINSERKILDEAEKIKTDDVVDLRIEQAEVSEVEVENKGIELEEVIEENKKLGVSKEVVNEQTDINEETQVSKLVTDQEPQVLENWEPQILDVQDSFVETLESKDNSDDILSSVQKNFKDISSIDIDENKIKSELNIPSLKDEIDKSFESYNPFKLKSKKITWWKINSPGYLNNILFRNNIKTYLLFNPKVMLAHYKYRYIIFGIRNDRHLGREYLICGVPGVYSIDENPFGSMGSWAQLEGYKPKYGSFGYWVILIDPRTGKLMKLK